MTSPPAFVASGAGRIVSVGNWVVKSLKFPPVTSRVLRAFGDRSLRPVFVLFFAMTSLLVDRPPSLFALHRRGASRGPEVCCGITSRYGILGAAQTRNGRGGSATEATWTGALCPTATAAADAQYAA